MILLASYASAVTLGLIWVLWGNRVRETAEADPVPPADTRPDPGRHALQVSNDRPSAPDRPGQADGAGPGRSGWARWKRPPWRSSPAR